MNRPSRGKNRRTFQRRAASPADSRRRSARRLTWWDRNRPIVRFVGLFVGLLVVFQLAYYEFVTQSSAFKTYLAMSTQTAAALLGVIGEKVVARVRVRHPGQSGA